MQPKSLKFLADIRHAVTLIRQFTAGRSLEEYRAEAMLRCAVERNFEIIGEAMRRLTDVDPSIATQIGESERIIAFRNVLNHGYDIVDDEHVWRVIQNDLPRLGAEVEALLRTSSEGADGP